MGLVLSRKETEKIVIGDIITITVVQAKGGKARIYIDAPRDVPVHRAEVLERDSVGQVPVSES